MRIPHVLLLGLLCGGASLYAIPPAMMAPQISIEEMDNGQLVHWLGDNEAANYGRDFGPVVTGQSSGALTIRVANGYYAAMDLPLAAPSVTSGAGDFSVNTAGFSTLVAIGGSTSFTITFSPSNTGAPTGQITLAYQADPANQPGVWTDFRINVRGEGVAAPVPHIAVTDMSASVRVYHDLDAKFGRNFGIRTIWGTPSTAVTLRVSNIGGGTLTLGTPGFASGGVAYVLDITGFATSLAAGADTTFTVAFNPSAVQFYPATITITHNDGFENNPFHILLSGQGASDPERLRVSDAAGPHFDPGFGPGGFSGAIYTGVSLQENAPASGARNFGMVAVGNSASIDIHLSNASTGYYDVFMTYLPGTDIVVGTPISSSPDFTVVLGGPWATTIASDVNGATVSFQVEFSPTSPGVKTGVITFTHDDGSVRTPWRINVMGDGGGGGGGNNAPTISVLRGATPVSNGGSATVAPGSTLASLQLAITVNDADGDACSLSGSVSNPGATGMLSSEFSRASSAVAYTVTPATGAFGAHGSSHIVSLQAGDGQGGVTSFSFTLVVSGSSPPPGGGPGPLAGGGGGGCGTNGGSACAWLLLASLATLVALALRLRKV